MEEIHINETQLSERLRSTAYERGLQRYSWL